MKVTIIGGGGRVGSCAAFALQCAGLVAEIQILDANRDLAEGEALDLLHGSAFAGDQKIYSGDYSRAADSDLFLITAGLRRKPDESRLDLINRNAVLFAQILDSIKSAGLRKEAHVFVVSNPVDILTDLAIREVVHAVFLDKQALLPVSSLVQGAYDIRDVCLSVPSVVGRNGVERHVEIKLWPKEVMGLQTSAKALKQTLAKVKV